MSKPAFNPDLPFEVADNGGAGKPPFDPNAAYSEVPESRDAEVRAALGKDRPSAYERGIFGEIPDEELNLLQRGEKRLVNVGLVKPGYETFAPETLRQKKLAGLTAANTAAMGYLPQIKGLIDARAEGKSVGSPEYIASRDELLGELGQAKLGTKATGIVLGLIPGAAAPQVLAAPETFGGAVATGAATAAGSGFLANPGDTPGKMSGLQIGERLENAKEGAKFGAALGAASGIPLARDALKSTAQNRAVKQAGAMKGDVRALRHKGLLPEAGDGGGNIGQFALDKKIVTPLSSLEDVAGNARSVAQREIGKVNKVYDALDKNFDRIANSPMRDALPSGEKIATELEQLIPDLDVAATADLIPTIQGYVDRFRSYGANPMPFGKVRKELQGFDKVLNWDKVGTPGKEVKKLVRGRINGVMEDAVDRVGQQSGYPALFDKWNESKQNYRMAQELQDIAEDRLNAAGPAGPNRNASLTDYLAAIGLAGSASAGGHGGLTAAATGLAAGVTNHLARKYGNAMIATGANRAAGLIDAMPMKDVAADISRQVPKLGLLNAQAKAGLLKKDKND